MKTSLGPKGMDKILQSSSRGGAVSVTNDGATILKSVLIDNPAAKVLIDISKVRQAGATPPDGTRCAPTSLRSLCWCRCKTTR